MEVILLERVSRLGQMGDIVNVKPGFARNFLLPEGKALRATDENRRQFDERRKTLELSALESKAEAEKIVDGLAENHFVLIRQASESGQLYGSVSRVDVVNALLENGLEVDKKQVQITTSIKSLGLTPVFVSLHPEVQLEVVINVARNEEEAENQRKNVELSANAAFEEEVAFDVANSVEEIFEKPEEIDLSPESDFEPTSTDQDPSSDVQDAAKDEAKDEV